MAHHLESLTAHYDQMADALKEIQAGETYEDEDIASKAQYAHDHMHTYPIRHESRRRGVTCHHWRARKCHHFHRGGIVSLSAIVYLRCNCKINSERMASDKATSEAQLKVHETSLDDLEELGEIMTEILNRQEEIEVGFI